MAPIVPTAVIADGKFMVLWVPTGGIADVDVPTQAELRAGTVLNISGFLTADGFTPGADEQTIADDRLSTTQSFAQPGRYSQTLGVKYVYDAQASPGDANNEAYETLKRGVQGYIVTRAGVAWDTDPTDGDVVDVWPVTCGIQNKLPPEANSVLKVEQKMHVRNAVEVDCYVGGVS
jgi:hypothetical protein